MILFTIDYVCLGTFSAFLDVMSTHRNEKLIVSSLKVNESDVTFGFCVLENEIRIYSRPMAFFST